MAIPAMLQRSTTSQRPRNKGANKRKQKQTPIQAPVIARRTLSPRDVINPRPRPHHSKETSHA
jgi:hypothetical protein